MSSSAFEQKGHHERIRSNASIEMARDGVQMSPIGNKPGPLSKLPPPGKQPPSSSHGDQTGYPFPYRVYQTRPAPRQLQSVVTHSFSVEDERDERSPGSLSRRRVMMTEQPFHPSMERRLEVTERDGRTTSERDGRQDHQPPPPELLSSPPPPHRSSGPGSSSRAPPYIHRTHSAGLTEYYTPSPKSNSPSFEPLKRSFYHHARSNETSSRQLPPEFMPPTGKRRKPEPQSRREIIVSTRMSPNESDSRWFGRAPSWESRELQEVPFRLCRTQSFPPPLASWSFSHGQPPSPIALRNDVSFSSQREYIQIAPAGEHGDSPRTWRAGTGPRQWVESSPSSSSGRFWGSPHSRQHTQQHRDDADSKRAWPTSREEDYERQPKLGRHVSFERSYRMDGVFRNQVAHPSDHHMIGDKGKLMTGTGSGDDTVASSDDLIMQNNEDTALMAQGQRGESIRLLALPQDKVSLSETLCLVRENIEVFTATQDDVDAPAPGRKHAVTVGQVGLRCIHCRHTTRCSDRVKRAVCYPSSIKRIYRTVIDMKLDHFLHCKFVPQDLKDRLTELKSVHTRSTGTTMQYFIRAANALGMEDGATGVRLNKKGNSELANLSSKSSGGTRVKKSTPPLPPLSVRPRITELPPRVGIQSSGSCISVDTSGSRKSGDMMSSDSFDTTGTPDFSGMPDQVFKGVIPLSLPEDKTALSPLRCFLREQVCAFSATEEDIAVRAPTTFSISLHQVGIGCIHCAKQPAKLRSNRAVCFPFSVGRIYQSVADIQRFHFGDCKNLPADVKKKFLSLQSASSKGSKGLATRQYWVTSAKKIGLVDTARGIRFGRDPSKPETSKAFSLDILAQVAFSVTTTSKQLVLPEDKPHIAEFLYTVMEQLQPCRFTEADRNKRRLKDVGCIGVECKHCAGQVDSRKFFWSSVNAVESNFVSVHTHMLECRMVPDELKQKLIKLKKLRKEHTAALKTGSQKAFFSRVWQRLHDEGSRSDKRADAKAEGNQSKVDSDDEEVRSDEPTNAKTEGTRVGPSDDTVDAMDTMGFRDEETATGTQGKQKIAEGIHAGSKEPVEDSEINSMSIVGV